MDILYFLTDRTRLIRQYYECAAQPFNEIVRKIEAEKGPRSGRVIRLNDKTVTLLRGGQQWRVAYCVFCAAWWIPPLPRRTCWNSM